MILCLSMGLSDEQLYSIACFRGKDENNNIILRTLDYVSSKLAYGIVCSFILR